MINTFALFKSDQIYGCRWKFNNSDFWHILIFNYGKSHFYADCLHCTSTVSYCAELTAGSVSAKALFSLLARKMRVYAHFVYVCHDPNQAFCEDKHYLKCVVLCYICRKPCPLNPPLILTPCLCLHKRSAFYSTPKDYNSLACKQMKSTKKFAFPG